MFTIDQLAQVEAAISSRAGLIKVRHGDREETYEGADAMLKLRDRMRRELGLDDGGGTGKGHSGRAIYPSYSKGITW